MSLYGRRAFIPFRTLSLGPDPDPRNLGFRFADVPGNCQDDSDCGADEICKFSPYARMQ